MKSPLLVLCSMMVMSAPAFAQAGDELPGFVSVNDERGAPVARVTDPETNNSLAASCTDGDLALTVRYGALSSQKAPQEPGDVTIVFASRGGTVEVPATSNPSEGLAQTASDADTHKRVRDALRSFSAMTSDSLGSVTINDAQGSGIGTITVSGKGTTMAYGRVLQACPG